MTIKRYFCKINYTEHSDAVAETEVYAHSREDADFIARRHFLDKRRDNPTIQTVELNELSHSKGGAS